MVYYINIKIFNKYNFIFDFQYVFCSSRIGRDEVSDFIFIWRVIIGINEKLCICIFFYVEVNRFYVSWFKFELFFSS